MLKNIPNSKLPVLVANEEQPAAALPNRIALDSLHEGAVNRVRSERGRPAIVLRQKGNVHAYDAKCPHMGSDLTLATCVGEKNNISCPWHGYRFSIETGLIVENPNERAMKKLRVPSPNFDPDMKPPFRLQSCEIEIKDGWVYVK